MNVNQILQGDCLEVLKTLESNSVDCCITSPPFYGLRDYATALWDGGDERCNHIVGGQIQDNKYPGAIISGVRPGIDASKCKKCGAIRIDKQIGLEKSPEEYVDKLVQIFEEVRRILKSEGTFWLNLGDSYAGSGGAHKEHHVNPGISNSFKRNGVPHWGDLNQPGHYLPPKGLKSKDLIGIPWMTAFALRKAGWYLRSDIIWNKKNCMPESVTDRPTRSHEYIFLLTKSKRYYYDYEAILEEATGFDGRKDTMYHGGIKDMSCGKHERWKTRGFKTKEQIENPQFHGRDIKTKRKNDGTNYGGDGTGFQDHSGYSNIENPFVRNKRDVWTVNTAAFKEAHFAVFPEQLIVDCVKAGCPKNGIVLDPFMGGGTTAVVARKLLRNFIGIELNPEYIKIANKRLHEQIGLFLNHDNSEILK